jgi:hypothetical protein
MKMTLLSRHCLQMKITLLSPIFESIDPKVELEKQQTTTENRDAENVRSLATFSKMSDVW